MVASPNAVLAQLQFPTALVVDAAGDLFVSECDWTYAGIVRIEPTGRMTMYAGTGEPGYAGDGGPATSARLSCPIGMAFGPDGALYFADHVNNRIRRIDATGVITTVAGSGPAGLDLGSFSGDGGPATKATLQEPYGVAFGPRGDMYITDRDNSRVRRIDPSGVIGTIAGNGTAGYSDDGGPGDRTSINFPLGIVVDPAADVIFVDAHNQRVRRIDTHGVISTVAGTGANLATGDGGLAAKAALADPENLAIDASGNLYVNDTVSNRIRRIDRHGDISTVFGSGQSGAMRDGMAAKLAPFPGLGGMTFGGAGDLYLTDGANVYRIDTKGTLTRVAGAP